VSSTFMGLLAYDLCIFHFSYERAPYKLLMHNCLILMQIVLDKLLNTFLSVAFLLSLSYLLRVPRVENCMRETHMLPI